MKDDIQTLPDNPELLKHLLQQNVALLHENTALLAKKNALLNEKEALLAKKDERIAYLLEQFHLARHRRFGAGSEAHQGQGELFNEAEEIVQEADEKEDDVTVTSHTRKKRNRPALPPELPRTEVYLDIPEEEKVCPCGEQMHKIGEERSEKLTFIPAKVEVTVYVRPKYACRSAEKQGEPSDIKIAPMPPSPIPKSIATPSLLAQIITAKYRYALPLNRQEVMFRQSGIELPRKQMAQWMIKCAAVLERMYALLKKIQLQQPVIHADETTVKVVDAPKKLSYMWVYCTGADSPPKNRPPPDNETDKQKDKRLKETPFRVWEVPAIVLFDYQPSRHGQHASDFLGGFSGYLQTDGFGGYNSLEEKEESAITLVGCLAHVRRKFMDAIKGQPKGKTGKAQMALSKIAKLYNLERRIKLMSDEQRYQERQEYASPLLDDLKAWLDKSSLQVPKNSGTGKAIHYALNQWHKVARYIDDGRLQIDNNRAERAIKPFTVGRKNWLYSQSANGANASATLYSIVQTALSNGLDPYAYLEHLFKELPARPQRADIHDLLPWNVTLAAG